MPHYALPAAWINTSSLVQLGLVGLVLIVTRRTPLLCVLGLAVAAGVLLTAVQIATGSPMLAHRP